MERGASPSMSWTGSGGGFRSIIVVIVVSVIGIVGVVIVSVVMPLLVYIVHLLDVTLEICNILIYYVEGIEQLR